MQRTKEQQDFIDELVNGKSALILKAAAGSGKTTTLVEGAHELDGSFTVLSLAFNKHSATELQKRMPEYVECKTLNALGHRAWSNWCPVNIKVSAGKIGKIVTDVMWKLDINEQVFWLQALKVVEQARIQGMMPAECKQGYAKSLVPDTRDGWEDIANAAGIDFMSDELYELSRRTLVVSIEQAHKGVIDFTDQLYMPVIFKAALPKYKLVMVDEAQDLTPIQHILVERTIALNGRIVAVGDSRQAIYAWRGACSDSLEQFEKKFKAKSLPLSVCFRCAKNIVYEAQKVFKGIEPFEQQEDGEVLHLETLPIDAIKYGDTVICRNNAPLVTLAYQLIRRRISVVMLGRDIGKGIIALIKRISVNKDPSRHMRDELITAATAWMAKEIDKAEREQKRHLVPSIQDKGESLLAILGELKPEDTGDHAMEAVREIFDRTTGQITLSTIHRAKGLEYDTVYFYMPSLLPSKYLLRSKKELMEDLEATDDPRVLDRTEDSLAVIEELLLQEKNLNYVARTRAKSKLVYVEPPR